jgi:hypothetical protein
MEASRSRRLPFIHNSGKERHFARSPKDKKTGKLFGFLEITHDVKVLEMIAEHGLGAGVLASHPRLRAALIRIEASSSGEMPASNEQVLSIVELCLAYAHETDPEERENILRTLKELSDDEETCLPTVTVEEWEKELESDPTFNYSKRRSAPKQVREVQKD